MAKQGTNVVRMAFNGGELAPRLEGRIDIEKAQIAVRQMRNMTVRFHGGAWRRPGLRYVATIPSS